MTGAAESDSESDSDLTSHAAKAKSAMEVEAFETEE